MSSMMHQEDAENGPGRISGVAPPPAPRLLPYYTFGPTPTRPEETIVYEFEYSDPDDVHGRLSHPLAGVHQSGGRVGPPDLVRNGYFDSSGSNDAAMSCAATHGTAPMSSPSLGFEDEPRADEPKTSVTDPSPVQDHADVRMALTRENLARIPVSRPLDRQLREILDFGGTAGVREPPIIHRRAMPCIVVIGVGYVGEHLVNVFSNRFHVIGYDISPERERMLSRKYERNPRVLITSSTTYLRLGTYFLIAVPTLLRQDKTVDSSFLESALEAVASSARPGSTVVIESSVAVGMTRRLLGPMARERGLYAGMSPERVDPGRTVPPAHAIPKIVSGLDDIVPGSLRSIRRVYDIVFDRIIAVSTPEVAEMTKLYENCQRMMCIAFANEMADACESHGISSFEVSQAAATKPFGYMPMMPSLGVGGHCIPVNPFYLLSTNDFPLLRAATMRMRDRPAEIARRSVARLYKRLGWRLEFELDEEMRGPMATPPDSDSDISRMQQLREDPNPALVEALQQIRDGTLVSEDHGNPDGETDQADDGHDDASLEESDESIRDDQPLEDPSQSLYLPRVLVVGIGFKAGQSHLVNSPGVALAQSLLALKKVSVKWCDPLVTQLAFKDVPRFDEAEWSKSGLEAEFDLIIVAFRQHGLDFGVLLELQGVDVEMWCA